MKSILSNDLIKKRELIYGSGSQYFLNDKSEIIMRKSPNLIMSPYDCVKQLKMIYTQIENLNVIAEFFTKVISDWEAHTKETGENNEF